MFGQNFYSPHDITVSSVQEDERPYAAWLYVGAASRLVTHTRLRTVEVQVGTTGKAALGKEVQTWWHARPWVGAPEPKGWAHQVRAVPGGVGLIATWDDRIVRELNTTGARPYTFADMTPYYRVTLGNVHDFVAAGSTARVGYNLQRGWREKIGPTVRTASVGQVALPALKPRKFEAGAFGSIEGRLVGWNALLQHDTYTPRRLNPISRAVVDLETGIALGYGRLSGGFRFVWRSPEFDGARWNRFAGLFVTLSARTSEQAAASAPRATNLGRGVRP